MKSFLSILPAMSALLAGAAAAQTSSAIPVASGAETRVDWIGSVSPDCTVKPPPTIRPTSVAGHGQIVIRNATVTTRRIADCPELKVPARVVFYKSADGYKGPDSFTLAVDDGTDTKTRTYELVVGKGGAAN